MTKSWRPAGWQNPYPTDHYTQTGKIYYETDEGKHRIFEAGADAMLKALWKLARESPTGTFTLDSKTQYIYGGSTDDLIAIGGER